MPCLSTERVIAGPDTSSTEGRIAWAPARSLWTGGMLAAALILGPLYVTPGAVGLFAVTTALTLCAGHSVGMHRLLIHRSFGAPLWLEHALVYLGTLVGMAGPVGMVRLHDMRDWSQRQAVCHDLHAHRAPPWKDAWLQMHARLDLARPPSFRPEARLAGDPFYRWLEATWMLQQLPWAVLFYTAGGMPWLVWGIPVRITVSLTGHWFVGHLTHRRGPQGWVVDGAAVQGHDLPAAAWITFGEAWHGNHHAWPNSARMGLEPGQADPGWWLLRLFERLGWVWGLKTPHTLEQRPGVRRILPEADEPRPENSAAHAPDPLSGPAVAASVAIAGVIGVAAGLFVLIPLGSELHRWHHYGDAFSSPWHVSVDELAITAVSALCLLTIVVALIHPLIAIAVVCGIAFRRSIARRTALWCLAAPVVVWLFVGMVMSAGPDSAGRGRGFLEKLSSFLTGADNLLFLLSPAVSALAFYLWVRCASRSAGSPRPNRRTGSRTA